MKKLMKYKLEDGRIYIVKEPTPKLSLEAFKDLLNIDFRGIIISRTPQRDFKNPVWENISYYWLAEIENGQNLPPNLNRIEKILELIPRKTVVHIDRIDYLIQKNGFPATLECLHRIRESAYLNMYICILSIDPITMKQEELRRIEKEGKCLESFHTQVITDKLFEIMKLIFEQNSMGLKPSYTVIGDELCVSKPTMRKRIQALRTSGYIKENVIGRRKTLELTTEGKQLFMR